MDSDYWEFGGFSLEKILKCFNTICEEGRPVLEGDDFWPFFIEGDDFRPFSLLGGWHPPSSPYNSSPAYAPALKAAVQCQM